MIGNRYTAPAEVVDSRVVQVIGREKHERDCRYKLRGTGDTTYWCVEVRDGKPRGPAFAVGSDELKTWEKL